MKSKHLARADFLRELSRYAAELYDLGDFTSTDSKREALSSKIEGFAAAGTIIEVVSPDEVQKVIDRAHFEAFGEEREARRARILEERAAQAGEGSDETADRDTDWDVYDTPAVDRRNQ
jgi:Zn-finger domain-containing protein